MVVRESFGEGPVKMSAQCRTQLVKPRRMEEWLEIARNLIIIAKVVDGNFRGKPHNDEVEELYIKVQRKFKILKYYASV